MRKVVAIIGGRERKVGRDTFHSLEVVYHDARVQSRVSRKALERIVKQANVVILRTDACSHGSMYLARSLSKRYNKPIHYLHRMGRKSLLQWAQEML